MKNMNRKCAMMLCLLSLSGSNAMAYDLGMELRQAKAQIANTVGAVRLQMAENAMTQALSNDVLNRLVCERLVLMNEGDSLIALFKSMQTNLSSRSDSMMANYCMI